jgi:hypothetical protein
LAAERVSLEFLGPRLFRFENPDLGGCISLDFLGFSRPNLDLSMGYAEFSLKKFFVALLPFGAFGEPGPKAAGEAVWGSEVFIE